MNDEEQDAYAEWLMAQSDLHICNGDSLIYHLERQTRYEEFTKWSADGVSQ